MKPNRPWANLERLHQLMTEEELDAVVVRSGQNVTYLSGVVYPGTLQRHLDLSDSRRGVLVVWPREGEPVLIFDTIAAGPAERDTCIEKLHPFDGFNSDAFSSLVEVLRAAGLDKTRVGLEANIVGAGDWHMLQRTLPGMEMIDCTRLMDRVRWIKTAAEIECIKQAAALLDECYLEVFPTIRPGDTERDVHARLIGACIEKGAGWAHGIFNTSSNRVIYCGEGDSVLERGDVIRTDYVVYLDGYPGHQNRNAVLGKPTVAQRDTYARYREQYLATIDRCRAGARVCDVFRATVESFAEQGWDYQAGLIGHSVGPWWHQQAPILTRTSEDVLEAGMVLAIEPFVEYWHTQDLILLTEKEPELLSTCFDTTELMAIDL